LDSSNRSKSPPRRDHVQAKRVAVLRHLGYRGKTILRHRAFRTLPLQPFNLVRSGLLALLLTALWIAVRPAVGRLWAAMFDMGFRLMGIPGTVGAAEVESVFVNYGMPRIDATGPFPGMFLDGVAGIVTLCVFLATFAFPVSFTPVSYLLRAVCFIQASAVVYFAVVPNSFPHSLSTYMAGMLDITMAYLGFIPALMGFTYYIFDVSMARSAILTTLTVAHLVIFTPLQYLVHILVIVNGSLLFMPVLYAVFGILPQVGVFIAFYSWGMSWPDRHQERHW
jgi:hypothetical protein